VDYKATRPAEKQDLPNPVRTLIESLGDHGGESKGEEMHSDLKEQYEHFATFQEALMNKEEVKQ